MKRIILLFLFLLFFETSFSQVFYHLQFGRSVSSIGTGEQHLTLIDPVNAIAGNPANLIYENGITISSFRIPSHTSLWESFQLTNVSGSFNYKNKHFFGVEYSKWELGKYYFLDQYGIRKELNNYEKTFSIGYAQKLNDKLSIGSKLTYGIQGDVYNAKHLMFSAGLTLREKLFDKNLVLGLSFMNFSDRVKIKSVSEGEFYAENPSSFVLGLNYNLISTLIGDVFSLLEFNKGIISHTNGVPDNSFKAFFNSWKDFNLFLETKIGFVLSSNPVQLYQNFKLKTNYFIGYSTGKYSGEFYNYGMQFSLSYLDYSLILGFGGRWFSARNYLPLLENENFDITLNKKINWFFNEQEQLKNEILNGKDLSISFGITNSLPLGIWKSNWENFVKFTTDNFLSYDLDFEINLNNYLSFINTFSYWRTKTKLESEYYEPKIIDEDAYAILSGFSLTPFRKYINLFISSKIGVLRLNPIPSNIYPQYFNLPIIVFSTGYKLDIFKTHFQLIPNLNLVTFIKESRAKDVVFGYKKLDFGLKIGYKL